MRTLIAFLAFMIFVAGCAGERRKFEPAPKKYGEGDAVRMRVDGRKVIVLNSTSSQYQIRYATDLGEYESTYVYEYELTENYEAEQNRPEVLAE